MATGYQYRACSNFPELTNRNEYHRIGNQPALLGEEYDEAHSEIVFFGDSGYEKYWKYHVKHEARRNITVRFEKRIVKAVIQVKEFLLFLAKDNSHVLLATNEHDCNEFLDRVKDEYETFSYIERLIDLAEMQKKEAMDVGGAWFANLQIADVRSAAVFGETVTDSVEWERYANSGDISMLYMNYLFGENVYKVNVTKNGTVVLMQNLSEDVRLKIVETVSQLITPFIQNVES